jgi:Domain of unknown function (DUF4143)
VAARRIVRLGMPPMALAERGLVSPTISLGEMRSGSRPVIEGDSPIQIDQYTDEIVRSGFPGIRRYDGRLATAPKHHLADPALAVRLLGLSAQALFSSSTPSHEKFAGPLVKAMFESLVALSACVFETGSDAGVFHFRTRDGDREVDVIVQGSDRRVVALSAYGGSDFSHRGKTVAADERVNVGKRSSHASH